MLNATAPPSGTVLLWFEDQEPDSGSSALLSMTLNTPPQTVLVVDDEPLLLMDAVDILESKGFETIEAKGAEEALLILASRSDISLLFTDMNMPPGRSGLALAEEVHQRWPHVLLVVTSAAKPLPDDDIPDHGRFIAKPYAAADLVGHIEDMIGKADV